MTDYPIKLSSNITCLGDYVTKQNEILQNDRSGNFDDFYLRKYFNPYNPDAPRVSCMSTLTSDGKPEGRSDFGPIDPYDGVKGGFAMFGGGDSNYGFNIIDGEKKYNSRSRRIITCSPENDKAKDITIYPDVDVLKEKCGHIKSIPGFRDDIFYGKLNSDQIKCISDLDYEYKVTKPTKGDINAHTWGGEVSLGPSFDQKRAEYFVSESLKDKVWGSYDDITIFHRFPIP